MSKEYIRDKRPPKPSFDSTFVTQCLADDLIDCKVGSKSLVFDKSLSDHLPVIAEFLDQFKQGMPVLAYTMLEAINDKFINNKIMQRRRGLEPPTREIDGVGVWSKYCTHIFEKFFVNFNCQHSTYHKEIGNAYENNINL